MGIAQQFAGRLDYHLYKGHDIFSFSQIMGGLSIYAAIILFVIKRDLKPKRQLHDLFLYFLGLDFFYYLYCFFLDLVRYLKLDDHPDKLSFYFQNTLNEIGDFMKWTVIATAAGFWALGATVLRGKGKKKGYIAMLVPLFIVMGLEIIDGLVNTVLYITDSYKAAHTAGYEKTIISLPIASLLTACIAMFISIKRFRKKPEQDTTQKN